MTLPVSTEVLRLRLAQAEAECAAWRTAGRLDLWQDARFVAAMLRLRLAHRLGPRSAVGHLAQRMV